MIELVDLYLAVSKMESGLMGAEPAELELSELVLRGVEEQSPLAKTRRIAVSFAVPVGLRVLADPLLLARVLQNLLNNALKYINEGGRVEITAALDEAGRVVLTVADDGPGIADNELPLLFDRYHQAKARREGRLLGMGLGLAFCRQALPRWAGTSASISARREPLHRPPAVRAEPRRASGRGRLISARAGGRSR